MALPDGVKWVQFIKSKTITINALYSAIIGLLISCGVEINMGIVTAGQTLLNVILRFFTEKPLNQK